MTFAQGHALVVGVSTHRYHHEVDIPISVQDVEAVAEVLRDEDACGYPSEQVHVIHGDSASKEHILTALDKLAAIATSKDTILLFYCGHGTLGTDGNYYLVSHDVRLQEGRVVAGTGVSEPELLDKLRTIKAERLLMIIDACYSGNLSPSRGIQEASRDIRLINPPEESAMALLGTGSGRIIITSCRERQVSYIGGGTISIFTKALVDGLYGKGVHNNRGMISAYSLYEYVFAEVREIVATQLHAVQEPELTVVKGVGPFAVALYKGASNIGVFDPDPIPQQPAVREVSAEKSARYFRQRIINTGGGAYVGGGSLHVTQGDFVGRDKIVHGDEVRGDKIVGNKVDGDYISVGDISSSQGIAIGQGAQTTVESVNMSGFDSFAQQQLRTVLEDFWEQLGATQLSREQKRISQAIASNAIETLGKEGANPRVIIEAVRKLAEILKQTDHLLQEGTSLWQSVLKLAQLLGPLVGGARVVAGWFGIPF